MAHKSRSDHGQTSKEPSPFLTDNISILPPGRVLDIAMGSGRNALYLASRGYDVEGVDISPEAVQNALEAADQARVALKALVGNLETSYRIAPRAYDLIICFNYLQRSLIPQIKNGLRDNGVVMYETYTIEQARFGKPSNPEYLLKPNELLHLFSDFLCLRYHEGIMDGPRAAAGLIARKQ